MSKQKIIFVDDEPNVLNGLKRMLHNQRSEWEMDFASGGKEALELMEQKEYDVIVSDMKMPGMNGGELLTAVKEQHPHTIRIALSGYADSEMILESIKAIHIFLAKPSDSDEIRQAIERAFSLRKLLNNEDLIRLVSQIGSLPSLPEIHDQIMQEMASPDGSLVQVGELIGKDVAMTAKLLQLANSAFFGLTKEVTSPTDAASYIGFDVIKNLALSIKLFESFEGTIDSRAMDKLWRHSQLVGAIAGRLAKSEALSEKSCSVAAAAGMLHDVGKLMLFAYFQDEYKEAIELGKSEGMSRTDAEKKVLHTTHGEIGAYLLGLWGLPNAIVEAVAYHNQPKLYPSDVFNPVLAVQLSDALAHNLMDGLPIPDDLLALDVVTDDKLAAWKEEAQALLTE